jgi:hypothetical protein
MVIGMKENQYSDVLYARGFIISNNQVEPPHKNWLTNKLKSYHIYFDPRNNYIKRVIGDAEVFILGRVIDILNNTDDLKRIADNILEKLKDENEQGFFEYIDYLSGRYLILYCFNGDTKVLSDATGMRSIFYSTTEDVLIGSHCELVNNYVNSPPSMMVEKEWLTEYSAYQLPGHYTFYEQIHFLTPNTLFLLEKKEVIRFFPRKDLPEKNTDGVYKEISELILSQLSLLSENTRFLMSLSAGIDSRTTLAFTKRFKEEFLFFTYFKKSDLKRDDYSNKILNIDMQVVNDMVDNLGLEHSLLDLSAEEKNKETEEFYNLQSKNTFTPHNFKLSKLYYDKLPKERLHIRSNILEIGRMFYKKSYNNLPIKLTAEEMVTCYSPKAKGDERVKKAFENYINLTSFNQIYNYDPYDLLYWEYRMGTWHSQLLLESDPSHDTFILFNARCILEKMLAVPRHEKRENKLFTKLYSYNWPVLNYWEINNTNKKTDYFDPQFDNYGLPLNDIKFESGSYDDPSKQVPFESYVVNNRAKFFMETSNPKKGDFVKMIIPLNTISGQGYRCHFDLRNPYEDHSLRGRLAFKVLLNNEILFKEDICDWKEINRSTIKWKAVSDKDSLSIEVYALRNCEDWSWGRAATVLFEKLSLRKEKNAELVEVWSTSPYSKINKVINNNTESGEKDCLPPSK